MSETKSSAPQRQPVTVPEPSASVDPTADQIRQQQDELTKLAQITEELTRTMEKTRIAEYVQYLDHPWRLIWNNFLIGVARGLGSTLGLALVLTAIFFLIQKLILLNLPGISDFIADLILMIQENYHVLVR